MTSRPMSSKTKTFHAAPSVVVVVAEAVGAVGSVEETWPSSRASLAVMGALRLRMRLMLAICRSRSVGLVGTMEAVVAVVAMVKECHGERRLVKEKKRKGRLGYLIAAATCRCCCWLLLPTARPRNPRRA